MKISCTVTEADWTKMEKYIIGEALGNPKRGYQGWFPTKEQFDEWAGDVFWGLLISALDALGIEVE